MGDLEEDFLKKNVPGRYSSWADENEDRPSRHATSDETGNNDNASDSDDDDYYFDGLPNATAPLDSQRDPSQPHQPLRPSGNTGVKGVLADYREAQQQEQLRKEEERLESLRAFQRATRPGCRADDTNRNNNDNASEDDSSHLDDSDDEFIKKFRHQRLTQLQQNQSAAPSSSLPPTFSLLTSVSPEEYVQLVDSIDPRVFLVVHLYEASIQHCRMLHSTLEKVAQSMDWAKFIQVQALEASPTLDTICLPALLVYKRGELVHNLVRFMEFNPEDVMDTLEGLGCRRVQILTD